MVIILILSVLVLLIVWTLWTPLRVTLDTTTDTYGISWGSLASVRVIPVYQDLEVVLSVAGRRFKWSMIELISKATSDRAKTYSEARQTSTSRKKSPVRISSLTRKRFYRILKSCRVEHFQLQIDTGDYPLNAMLYPIARKYGSGIDINFSDKNHLELAIKNRPISIIKSLII